MSKTSLAAIAAFCVLLSACASSKPPRSERDGAQNAYGGAKLASPLALALTGLAAQPDGRIALADIDEKAAAQFDRFNADGSGAWTAIEHARWAKAILGDAYGRPTLRGMDRDGDSQVSEREFILTLVEATRRFDKDGNGLVERAELLLQMPEGRAQSRQSGGDSPQGQRPRPTR